MVTHTGLRINVANENATASGCALLGSTHETTYADIMPTSDAMATFETWMARS